MLLRKESIAFCPKICYIIIMTRQKLIIRTSIIGIVTNVFLVIFKMIVGVIAGSIAIILDAVNNLTDVCSSVVTIIGTKLASKRPDPEHPHGHGRYEYLAAMAVGLIVLLAGIMALIESIPKVIHPQLADYSLATIIVVVSAVITKLVLSRYVKRIGEKTNSSSLVASGIDAMFDAILSIATLVGIGVTMMFQISIDGILGVIISAFIIKTSIEILSESALDILGRNVDPATAQEIKRKVCSYPEVSGAYDLALHNYGPSEYIGSLYIQVPDDMTARAIQQLTRRISHDIYKKYNVTLTIGIYAEHTDSQIHREIRQTIERYLSTRPEITQMHGLYIDSEVKTIAFDLVIDYNYPEKVKLRREVIRQLKASYPAYRFHITLDLNTDQAKR